MFLLGPKETAEGAGLAREQECSECPKKGEGRAGGRRRREEVARAAPNQRCVNRPPPGVDRLQRDGGGGGGAGRGEGSPWASGAVSRADN